MCKLKYTQILKYHRLVCILRRRKKQIFFNCNLRHKFQKLIINFFCKMWLHQLFNQADHKFCTCSLPAGALKATQHFNNNFVGCLFEIRPKYHLRHSTSFIKVP